MSSPADDESYDESYDESDDDSNYPDYKKLTVQNIQPPKKIHQTTLDSWILTTNVPTVNNTLVAKLYRAILKNNLNKFNFFCRCYEIINTYLLCVAICCGNIEAINNIQAGKD